MEFIVDMKDDQLVIKYDDSKLKAIKKSLVQGTNRHIRIGWLNKRKYQAKGKNKGLTIAQVASWTEFGTKHNYPRPHLSITMGSIKKDMNPYFAEYFKALLKCQNGSDVLQKINKMSVKKYKDTVKRQGFRSLSPITIKLKGHDTILINTGKMVDNFESKTYKTNIHNMDKRAR